MRVLGMISGTSHDGVDAALVDFELDQDVLTARLVHGSSTPYPDKLRAELVDAMPPRPSSADEVCRLDTRIGQYFAEVAETVVEAGGPTDAVCSHGQTVYHWVEDDHCLGTLQLGAPAWIAEQLGVPVVADVRSRDIAAGGHGAPLVPLLDSLLLAGLVEQGRTAAALNLGGIANMTVVTGGDPLAYDIGPANALIDAVVQDRGLDPAGYDTGGRIARSGTVNPRLLAQLIADPYYAQIPPKSTGKELFHHGYVAEQLHRFDEPVSDADLVATLTQLTADLVVRDLRRSEVTKVIAAGGGVENPVLMELITAGLPGVDFGTTEEFGVPPEIKEAFAFALIGWCTLHGLPANVSSATGSTGPRLLGSITPGRGPLTLPATVSMPRSLEVRSVEVRDPGQVRDA
ncbi:anhydro-N-acetylmuramic acid kinase [Propionibacteriaceae bacterium Y1685]|uniref:anhydro-N-acetylmuramic acid kinase n=1 Tax=Microlunatus sp. Y1700 TaxID=3418487 RepID=UPI003B78E2F6